MGIIKKAVRISLDNVLDFPKGTRVLFDYGAMCGQEEGVLTGEWSHDEKFGITQLVAELENGSKKTINQFSAVGIGTYLLDEPVVSEPKVRTDSPWYVGEA